MSSAAIATTQADIIPLAREVSGTLEALLAEATAAVRARVSDGGKVSAAKVDAEQHAAHGLSWLATYITGIREAVHWAERLASAGTFGETEALLLAIATGEYTAQVFGGIPMSQNEIVRLADLGLDKSAVAARRTAAVETLIDTGNTPANRARLVTLMREADGAASIGATGLDETLEAIRRLLQQR